MTPATSRRAPLRRIPTRSVEASAEAGAAPAEVLVVVPTLNEEAAIEPCLRSLMADGEAQPEIPDIVVADGGSADATREIVQRLAEEFPNIHLIDNPRRLQSAGINHAVGLCARSHHRVLVRADAHAVYPPGYVHRVAQSLRHNQAAALVVAMDARGERGFQRAAAWIVDTPLGSGGAAHRGGKRSGPVDHGHHAGMCLDWFRRIGGYDPDFSHNEDAEFDHRLRHEGGQIWLDAGLRLDYDMRQSLRALARQYWNYGRGRARTVMKHRIRPRLRQMVPPLNLILLTLSAALLALGLATDSPLALVAGSLWPFAYLALLCGTSIWMAVRHRESAGLWAGPALGAMHLSWGAGFLTGLTRKPSEVDI